MFVRHTDRVSLERLTYQPLHVADGLFEADHDRAGDDAVADVQLAHVGDRGDRLDVAVGESVAGVEQEARGADLLAEAWA